MRPEVVEGQPLIVVFGTTPTGAEFKPLNPHSQTMAGRIEKFVAADEWPEADDLGVSLSTLGCAMFL